MGARARMRARAKRYSVEDQKQEQQLKNLGRNGFESLESEARRALQRNAVLIEKPMPREDRLRYVKRRKS